MYNSINPVNIVYRNPRQNASWQNGGAQNQEQAYVSPDDRGNQNGGNHFPNGNKVAIDYSKNTVNIAQILTDFRSTVLAINAPDDVSKEVMSYLTLVEGESKKENPSRDVIVSNLKNASKVSDDYIAKSLNKPSKVVEGWIDALFMQKINLKSDPDHINPDFQLEIPDKAPKAQVAAAVKEPTASSFPMDVQLHDDVIVPQNHMVQDELVIEHAPIQSVHAQAQAPIRQEQTVIENKIVDNNFDEDLFTPTAVAQAEIAPVAQALPQEMKKTKSKFISSSSDVELSKTLKQAKELISVDDNPAGALVILNDALGEADENTNTNLKAALHYERGKIFDEYDYVNYALRDYYEATKCEDENLKSRAHLNMGRIYDDYVEFESAVDHYQDAVAYSGEANNTRAQAKILGELAGIYSSRFDVENAKMLNELALEAANNSNNNMTIAKTNFNVANNYEYVNDDHNALMHYKQAIQSTAFLPETVDLLDFKADAYESAAYVMGKLNNDSKSESLLSKARYYQQKAQLERNLEVA